MSARVHESSRSSSIGAPPHDRFRTAARAYFLYGLVYLVGGAYLTYRGVGVRGATDGGSFRYVTTSGFVLAGLILVIVIPYLLRRRRPAFERWVLSRRDFARVLSALMAYRAYAVGHVALKPEVASVPAPWGGDIGFRAGAIVFFVVTVVALIFVARAAWTDDREVVA
jgi:hypothetical protein